MCFAPNALCVTLQLCPSGCLWPHQGLEACTHGDQPTTLLQDMPVHNLLDQTGTLQGWRRDVGNVLFRSDRGRGMNEALCSEGGTVTGKRRGREKGKQAAFATAPVYCSVGCRAAVLLHVMLVLGCASLQCMWKGTVLWGKKFDCTTKCWALTLWYCLGRGSPRAGSWPHGFVVPREQEIGKGCEAGDPTRTDKLLVQCSALPDHWKLCTWGHIFFILPSLDVCNQFRLEPLCNWPLAHPLPPEAESTFPFACNLLG